MKKILFKHKCILIITFLLLIIPTKNIIAQWYVVADESHKRAMWEMYQIVVPDRQGDFPTKKECEDAIDRAGMDALQRSRHHCECESNCDEQNSSISNYQEEQYNSGQNPADVDDYETQMMQRNLNIEKDKKEKAALEKLKNENIKNDLLSKLKGNKSFNQLKTTSELSEQGSQNIDNQIEIGRVNSESAFTDGKIKLKKSNIINDNIPPVSPPAIVVNQKKLFEYVDREMKVVQSKILEVQKEKIQILEKKNKIQEKFLEQKITVEKLKTEKIELKEDAKKEEIDSLLWEAMQLLEESEMLNENAGKELESKDKLLDEQEAFLNKLQTSYDHGKDKPEKFEQLLNELQSGKK